MSDRDEHTLGDFPGQFDELWHQVEDIATEAIDNHHECGGGEDAHLIADEIRKLIDQVSTRRAAEAEIRVLTELDNAYDEITADNFHEFYIRKVASLQPTKGSK